MARNAKAITARRQQYRTTKLLDIREDGIAWKCVRADYTDFYSGKYKHAVGEVVAEPDYDPDTRELCGRGLHVSPTLRQAIRCSRQTSNATTNYPWRFFRVRVEASDVIVRGHDKLRCKSYRVEQEYTLDDIFGHMFGGEFPKRLEEGRAELASWSAIPWMKPEREITEADIDPRLSAWFDALEPYRSKRDLNRVMTRKARIVRDRGDAIRIAKSCAADADADAAAAAAAADDAADADAAAAAADAADAAADAADAADADAADAAADAAAAAAAAAAADAAVPWPYWSSWCLRPRHALWRMWRWSFFGLTTPNPWAPIVALYRLGVAPIGYRCVDGEVVFVVYAPPVARSTTK